MRAASATDFEVSTPALDRVVDLLRCASDIYGVRFTGAGFGGACVASVPTGHGG